jgi:hypothetical protein
MIRSSTIARAAEKSVAGVVAGAGPGGVVATIARMIDPAMAASRAQYLFIASAPLLRRCYGKAWCPARDGPFVDRQNVGKRNPGEKGPAVRRGSGLPRADGRRDVQAAVTTGSVTIVPIINPKWM